MEEICIGIIYKIINDVNNKVYIGMTTRTLDVRKSGYLKVYNNPNARDYNYKICRAMRKIGFDHFMFTEVESCNDEKLPEREKYYIKLYDSIKNGYNEALGGKGKPLWTDKKVTACKVLYENGWLLKDRAEIFNSNPSVIGKKLRQMFLIDTRLNSINSFSKPIVGVDKNENAIEFKSISEAGRYITQINPEIEKDAIAISAISKSALSKNKEAYGYKWSYKIT